MARRQPVAQVRLVGAERRCRRCRSAGSRVPRPSGGCRRPASRSRPRGRDVRRRVPRPKYRIGRMQRPELRLYRVDAMRELDRRAIAASGEDGYALMRRAGAAALRRCGPALARGAADRVACAAAATTAATATCWRGWRAPRASTRACWPPACPAARQARPGARRLRGRRAARLAIDAGAALADAQLVVDALLGIGTERDPEGATARRDRRDQPLRPAGPGAGPALGTRCRQRPRLRAAACARR